MCQTIYQKVICGYIKDICNLDQGFQVIPAKTVEALETSTSIRRVAAYVRVSTDNDEQTSSYELQKNYYTDYIKAQPGWEFAGIYDDEGISGTSLEHRKGMQQMIEDCIVSGDSL